MLLMHFEKGEMHDRSGRHMAPKLPTYMPKAGPVKVKNKRFPMSQVFNVPKL